MTDDNNADDLHDLGRSAPTSDYYRPYRDPYNLRVLYHDRGWSQSEIATFYDVAQPTISEAMDQAGIETRQVGRPTEVLD